MSRVMFAFEGATHEVAVQEHNPDAPQSDCFSMEYVSDSDGFSGFVDVHIDVTLLHT